MQSPITFPIDVPIPAAGMAQGFGAGYRLIIFVDRYGNAWFPEFSVNVNAAKGDE